MPASGTDPRPLIGRFQPPSLLLLLFQQKHTNAQIDVVSMPICIECRYPIPTLYTTYSKADDKALGKGVRLTQCPRCKRFADKYVEHDFVVLFIDLVLIKPQVGKYHLSCTGLPNSALCVGDFTALCCEEAVPIHQETAICVLPGRTSGTATTEADAEVGLSPSPIQPLGPR